VRHPSRRRPPRARLLLTLAALASLIAGYYAGQYWQRRPLAGLSAEVYPSGRPLEYPAGSALDPRADLWRLFLVADTRVGACRDLVRHYALVLNRLAAWPEVQSRLRLTLLAYDRPDREAVIAFTGGVEWAEVITEPLSRLDAMSGQLGILPGADGWCAGDRAAAILVSPEREAWALIPYEQATIMAENIRTVVAFVE
jgi:hypothetical protein